MVSNKNTDLLFLKLFPKNASSDKNEVNYNVSYIVLKDLFMTLDGSGSIIGLAQKGLD